MTGADVVIIGGGLIGLSIAYHLCMKSPGLEVTVLEKENLPGTGSSARATGGIRHQFSSPVNVELTRLSLPFLQDFDNRFGLVAGFQQHGYLFVTAHEGRWQALTGCAAMQNLLGVPTSLLSPKEAASLIPGLHNLDLLGGSFCGRDGTADPGAVLQGMIAGARRLGVRILTGSEAIGIQVNGGRVTAVRVASGRNVFTIEAEHVVNAAGPYARRVALMVGVDLPVKVCRRQVFVMESANLPATGVPLLVDLDTGFYLHREQRDNLLVGGTDADTRPGFEVDVCWEDLARVAAAAVRRLPPLENARVLRGYAGLRTVTPDSVAILGTAPNVDGFYLANGWSGHGFMHAPAAGLLLAELIVNGRTTSLDISPMSLDRFREGTPGLEPEQLRF